MKINWKVIFCFHRQPILRGKAWECFDCGKQLGISQALNKSQTELDKEKINQRLKILLDKRP